MKKQSNLICSNCGQPISSANKPHTQEDCERAMAQSLRDKTFHSERKSMNESGGQAEEVREVLQEICFAYHDRARHGMHGYETSNFFVDAVKRIQPLIAAEKEAAQNDGIDIGLKIAAAYLDNFYNYCEIADEIRGFLSENQDTLPERESELRRSLSDKEAGR